MALRLCAIDSQRSANLEPYAYLLHIIKALPKATTLEMLEALLPWNVKLAAVQSRHAVPRSAINLLDPLCFGLRCGFDLVGSDSWRDQNGGSLVVAGIACWSVARLLMHILPTRSQPSPSTSVTWVNNASIAAA